MTNKDIFINILKNFCSERFNVDNIVEYLETNTDFFRAPASTKFHLNYEGGLLQHCLDVYQALTDLCNLYYEDCDFSTIAIVALFHDICKTNYYKKEKKFVKKDNQWVQEEQFIIADQFPIGHGEKSIILLQQLGIKLTIEEILAIRWHMNGFDNSVKGGDKSISEAYNYSPLVVLLQTADLIATYSMETTHIKN